MKSLVAFVLYAYNEERFIREAIESAFAQTYSPLEIVLSDDGSADRTFEIMQEMAAAYKGPHLIITNNNEKNIGIGSQLNAAYQKAHGKLIVLANGDDISLPQGVARTVEAWEGNGKKATAITSYLQCIAVKGELFKRTIHAKVVFEGLEDGGLKRFRPVLAASLAVTRDVITRLGRLMDALILEDGPLYLRAALFGPGLHCIAPLCN